MTAVLSLQMRFDVQDKIQEIFGASCLVILFAAVQNIVLIYCQLKRPFKAEEDRGEDIEAGAGLDKEGSSPVLYACMPLCPGRTPVILMLSSK